MRTSSPIYSHEEISAGSGMVVAQHIQAARIGIEVLQRGGNAVDAAITTAFASGVLLPIWNGVGGGGVMTVHLDGGGGGSVDFGMQAAGLAHGEMFELDPDAPGLDVQGPSRRYSWPKIKDKANTEGYTSISIPGTVAGLTTALEKWGTIDLDQAIAPAIKLAREGFQLSRTVALSMAEGHALLSRFKATADIYLLYSLATEVEGADTIRKVADVPGNVLLHDGVPYTVVEGYDAVLMVDSDQLQELIDKRKIGAGVEVK